MNEIFFIRMFRKKTNSFCVLKIEAKTSETAKEKAREMLSNDWTFRCFLSKIPTESE